MYSCLERIFEKLPTKNKIQNGLVKNDRKIRADAMNE